MHKPITLQNKNPPRYPSLPPECRSPTFREGAYTSWRYTRQYHLLYYARELSALEEPLR